MRRKLKLIITTIVFFTMQIVSHAATYPFRPYSISQSIDFTEFKPYPLFLFTLKFLIKKHGLQCFSSH